MLIYVGAQLPYRTGATGSHKHLNQDQTSASLIQISRYRFSLVIQGLTKHLQRVNELVSVSNRPK